MKISMSSSVQIYITMYVPCQMFAATRGICNKTVEKKDIYASCLYCLLIRKVSEIIKREKVHTRKYLRHLYIS